MAIQVALHHKTQYRYDRAVWLGPQIIRLRPAPHCRTPIHGYSLTIVPANHLLHWQQDPQSNFLARVVFSEPIEELEVEVELKAELIPVNPFDFFLDPQAGSFPFTYDAETAPELCSYLQTSPVGPELAAYLAKIPRETTGTMDFLVELNHRLQGEIAYGRRMEPGIRNCEETLALREGSCRDTAWLLVQVSRNLGLAARFVSGYLIQTDEDKGDSGDLHAWAEIYLPGAGWVGFDPTSGLLATEGHIPLVCTPEAGRAAPISGTTGVCEVTFHHEVSVARY